MTRRKRRMPKRSKLTGRFVKGHRSRKSRRSRKARRRGVIRPMASWE